MIRGKEIIDEIDLVLCKSSNEKMKILFTVEKLEIMGGLETYLYCLGKELVERGHAIIIDCEHISLEMQKIFTFAEIWINVGATQVRDLADLRQISFIHCQPFGAARRALELNEITGLPIVITWHGCYYTEDFPKIATKAKKIICVSEEVLSILVQKYPLAKHKMIVVQNGIDLDIYKPIKTSESLSDFREVTFVGRSGNDRTAGLHCLIEGFLKTSFKRLNILGFKSLEGIVETPRLNFVGMTTSVDYYLQRADVVVGTGRGIREALGCGKPCIVMSNWGYDGIVTPNAITKQEAFNFSGRGIGEPLSVEKVKNDLELLLHKELRHKLGLYGRQVAKERYDIKKITHKTEIVYEQVVGDCKFPQVSILLPLYNHASFIRQCIESLLNQTYVNFELIIVNDGSNDDSLSEVKKFKDPRIKLIHRKENKGLPKTLNEALRLSSGEYITWTSADNLHHPEYLEKLVAVLEKDVLVGSVYSDYCQIDSKGVILRSMSKGKYVLNGKVNYGPSFMFRLGAVNQVGFFDEELFGTEDRDYSIRMAAVAPVIHLPEILYEYRIHEDSLTGKYVAKKINLNPAVQAISKKWQSLLLATEPKEVTLDRNDISFGKKIVLKPEQDCTINSNYNHNLNKDPIYIGRLGGIYRYLVKFNLMDFHQEVRILKAELQLFCVRNDNSGLKKKVEVIALKEPWQEHEVAWLNQPTLLKEQIAETEVTQNYRWISFDITRLTQDWVDNIIPNNGVCIKMLDESSKQIIAGFNRHSYNQAACPRLVLEITGKRRCLP